VNPVSFNIHPDAIARMKLLSQMLEDSANRNRPKSPRGGVSSAALRPGEDRTDESVREDNSDVT
jgi:hypothetical protein